MKVVAKDETNTDHVAAARVATILLNQPQVKVQIDREVAGELARQLIYGLPPSEGLPDVRIRHWRFE